MNNWKKNLIDVIKQKEKADRQLLCIEIFIGCLSSVVFLALIMVASFIQMEAWLRILLIVLGLAVFIIGCAFALRIEQTAGYYECAKCHHKYIPRYRSVLFAMHSGRTRYMKCPECGKKSWQKKRISK